MKVGRSTIACVAAGLLACAGGALSCDDRSEVPADLVQQQQPDASNPQNPATTRPTTQQLVEGPRTPKTLDVLPLVLQVPTSWKITAHGSGIVWLEGPTPAGEVRIHLKHQQGMTQRMWDQLVMGTQREIERAADPNTTLTMRELGPATVIERRTVGQPISAPVVDATGVPTLDAKGDVVMHTMLPMRWRVSVFVPREGQIDHYELNFIDLEKPQYDADRAFLEDVLQSLRYTGPVPAPTSGPAAAPR